MEPTIGRIVHYYPHPHEFEGNDSSTLPAVIVRVWGPDCVNLKVLTDGPVDVWKTSVCRLPEGAEGSSGFWSFPPRV